MLLHDVQRLEHIIDYCEDIDEALSHADKSFEKFSLDKTVQYAISFSIMQIGELVGRLSDELRASTKEKIDWSSIKGLRNIIAHNYGEIRLNVVWNIAVNDIPELKAFCEEYLDNL